MPKKPNNRRLGDGFFVEASPPLQRRVRLRSYVRNPLIADQKVT